MLGLRVLNADDGKKIYQYKGSVEGRCATGAVIRDGDLPPEKSTGLNKRV